MNVEQIQISLLKRFSEDAGSFEKRRIVFWYDADQSFSDFMDQIILSHAKIHHLTPTNSFATKRLLEIEDPESNYLIYAPFARPKNEEDWLLDIYLYSEEFSADKVSLIMNDLGIADFSLKGFIHANQTFFDNKDRYRRLQAIPHTQWDEEILELAMMAVACKQKTASLEDILKALLLTGIDEAENASWEQIGKWPGYEGFWKHVRREYGVQMETPTLRKLLLALFITSLEHQLPQVELPAPWGTYRLKQKANGVVFLDHWMNNREDSPVFDEYAIAFEKELNLREMISGWQVDQYQDADLFPIFDQALILHIINGLLNGSQEYERYQNLISARRTKHWYEKVQDIYTALSSALELMVFKKEHSSGFPIKSAYDTFKFYTQDYYQADQAYRCFYEAYDRITDQEILKKLQPLVENLYDNGYLQPLASAWSQLVEGELLNQWFMPGVPQQNEFYDDKIRPIINRDREKVYVIISDAFRFEAAKELADNLNREATGSADIKAMQGVIPSYTRLGMASLLPGKQIRISPDGRVTVDGKETETLEQRKKILQDAFPESTAIGLQDLLAMSRDEGREIARAHRVVYIYHNVVDSVGDKQASEHRVFSAVRQTIDDLTRCIKYITNQLNGSNIFITADHGFLYQREALAETDKVGKEKGETVDGNRRFILAAATPESGGLMAIDMKYILGSEAGLKAIVPKGIHRFKTQGGGTAYVHGGASLQEIVVPLIQYKSTRAAKGKETATKVEVKLTNTVRKITNNTFTLNFFQTERVSENRLARTVRMVIMDLSEGEQKISDEKTIIADKDSERAEDRTFAVRLTLKGGRYDKGKNYYLCLFDDDNDLNPEIERIPFTINLGIANDFDDF